VKRDARGTLIKPFTQPSFTQAGLEARWRECFWSVSHLGVIRGFHAQHPPHELEKLVFCASGATHDVVLDLRVGSPTYGRTAEVTLAAERANALYVPRGVAHAFQALTDEATLVYLVTAEHAPEADHGVRWDSVPVEWPLPPGPISERDRSLPPLGSFASPFRWAP
jgi:dTDP-4-dehydrorhamnose 3,5-epimerase